MMNIEAAARAIAEARKMGRKLADYPCDLPDMAQALAIQEAMAGAMGVPVAGWKVGLTSARAQEICGVDSPKAGPVFSGSLWENGAEIGLAEQDVGVIEAEIGFRMKADLLPGDGPFTRDSVQGAVGEVMPVFELVNKRLPGGLLEKAEWMISDGVFNRGVVLGAPVAFDPAMDLAGETVEVRRDGALVTQGEGLSEVGDPLDVLVWLANDLAARGKHLKAGDVIASGLMCDVVQAIPGARVEADFSTLGKVTLSVARD